jgi:hypothetical protein
LRILFVGVPNNIHTVRWIGQIADQGWDLHLFPGYDTEVHPDWRNITIYSLWPRSRDGIHPSVRLRTLWIPPIVSARTRYRIPAYFSSPSGRATLLALLIRWLKPDIVHSLQTQSSAYGTADAKANLARWFPNWTFPRWIVSNWGADIYMFGHLPEHAERIRRIMSSCDYYHCECQRDVELGRSFGFQGEALPILPAAGGFDLAQMRRLRTPGPTSARRVIVVKGYQDWAGRGLVGLRAIERCAEQLRSYRIFLFLRGPLLPTTGDVRRAAEALASSTGLAIEVEPPEGWPRDEVLRLHGCARISIGLSLADAIGTSMLESMVMGSFPIQSNTGCYAEWVRDGETALMVPPEDPECVETAIRRAISDDHLVNSAATANARTVERLDQRLIQPQVVDMYNRIRRDPLRRARRSQTNPPAAMQSSH